MSTYFFDVLSNGELLTGPPCIIVNGFQLINLIWKLLKFKVNKATKLASFNPTSANKNRQG